MLSGMMLIVGLLVDLYAKVRIKLKRNHRINLKILQKTIFFSEVDTQSFRRKICCCSTRFWFFIVQVYVLFLVH